ESYGSDYYQKTHRNWFENPNYPLFKLLALEVVGHNAKEILDVGCGNGAFLKYLAQSTTGIGLHGIDLSDAAESVQGIEFLQGDFMTYDFNKKFDAVISLAVIEHLSEVSTFVKRIHDLLNP
ncbi:MAG: class I SAM-dependent methyltransferase, partial [Chlorobium sp.]|nr:class I SAM-dependent methyltransferase [Chlorobium sp.]